MTRHLLIALAALLVIGCRERTPEVDVPSSHPANASAPAAPVAPASTTLALDAPATAPAASPKTDTYVCPMHPDVVRHEPGKCPKCGMTLKPQQKSP